MRILIADRHDILRRGVRALIQRHVGWDIVAEASDGQQALELALQHQPDVAVIAVDLPTIGGIDLTRRLREECPVTRVLLFTKHDDDQTLASGLAAGARGYVLKTDTGRILEAGISALGANRVYITETLSERLLAAGTAGQWNVRKANFTPRELEVGRYISEGKSNREIADIVGISHKTVECHRATAMRKAGVTKASEFVRFAIKHHLLVA